MIKKDNLGQLTSYATRYRLNGNYRNAIFIYNKILTLTRRSYKSNLSVATKHIETILSKADLNRIEGKFTEAKKNYLSALIISSQILKKKKLSSEKRTTLKDFCFESGVGLALTDKAAGRYRLAYKKLKHLLSKARNRKDKQAEGFILWHLGMLLRFMGYPQKGLSSISKALKIFDEIHSDEGKGFCLCALGGILRVLGSPIESLKKYSHAFLIFRRIKDAYGLAYSYCGQANALKTLGRWNEALKLYRQSEKIYQKTGDISSLGFVYKGMAGCYWGKLNQLTTLPENEREKILSPKCRPTKISIRKNTHDYRLFRRYFTLAESSFIKSKDTRGLKLLRKEFS